VEGSGGQGKNTPQSALGKRRHVPPYAPIRAWKAWTFALCVAPRRGGAQAADPKGRAAKWWQFLAPVRNLG